MKTKWSCILRNGLFLKLFSMEFRNQEYVKLYFFPLFCIGRLLIEDFWFGFVDNQIWLPLTASIGIKVKCSWPLFNFHSPFTKWEGILENNDKGEKLGCIKISIRIKIIICNDLNRPWIALGYPDGSLFHCSSLRLPYIFYPVYISILRMKINLWWVL